MKSSPQVSYSAVKHSKVFLLGIRQGWPLTATSIQHSTGSSWTQQSIRDPGCCRLCHLQDIYLKLPWVWTFNWGQGWGRERESDSYGGVCGLHLEWHRLLLLTFHLPVQSLVTSSHLTAREAGKQLCAQEEGEMDSWLAIKSNSFPSALFQLRERGLREVLGHRE